MFGINKNGTKHKIGIVMPSFFPASRTSYSNSASGLTATNAQDAIDELANDVVEYYDYAVSMNSSGSVSPFSHYNSVDISAFASGKKILSAQPIVINSAQRAIATINNTQTTAYVYGTDSTNIVLRVAAKKA